MTNYTVKELFWFYLGINANIISDIGSLEYSKFSCVILTVDNQEARMWVNRYSYLNGTPLIDTGIAGQSGNVIVLFSTPSGPCLECGWPESEYDLLNAKYRCLLEGLALTESPIPMVITSAAIIGGMAVQECVRVLHLLKAQDSDEASIINYDGLTLSYDGEKNYFPKWRQTRNTKCHCDHERITNLKVLPFTAQRDDLVSHITSRIREHLAREHLGVDHVELHYDREIVYAVKCRSCGHEQPIKPIWAGGFRRKNCPKCKEFELAPGRAVTTLADGYTLKELGIPPNHLLSIWYSTQDGALHKAEVYMVTEG